MSPESLVSPSIDGKKLQVEPVISLTQPLQIGNQSNPHPHSCEPELPEPDFIQFTDQLQFPPLPTLSSSQPNTQKSSLPSGPNPWNKSGPPPSRPTRKYKLRFIPPVTRGSDVVGVCSAEAIGGELQILDNTAIGFFLGKKPSFSHVRASLLKQWKLCGSVTVLQLLHGGTAFRFSDSADRDMVIEEGMFYVGGQPIFIQPWERNIHSGGVLGLKKVPLWVSLPGLPLHLWGEESLSTVCSVLGRPLFTDQITASRSRWAFARACVEFSGDKPIRDSVTIEDDDGNLFHQQVKYMWKPPHCLACGVFGHTGKECQDTRPDAEAVTQGASIPAPSIREVSNGTAEVRPEDKSVSLSKEIPREVIIESAAPSNDGNVAATDLNARKSSGPGLLLQGFVPVRVRSRLPSRVRKTSSPFPAGSTHEPDPDSDPQSPSHLTHQTLGRVSALQVPSTSLSVFTAGQSNVCQQFRPANSNFSVLEPLAPSASNRFRILETCDGAQPSDPTYVPTPNLPLLSDPDRRCPMVADLYPAGTVESEAPFLSPADPIYERNPISIISSVSDSILDQPCKPNPNDPSPIFQSGSDASLDRPCTNSPSISLNTPGPNASSPCSRPSVSAPGPSSVGHTPYPLQVSTPDPLSEPSSSTSAQINPSKESSTGKHPFLDPFHRKKFKKQFKPITSGVLELIMAPPVSDSWSDCETDADNLMQLSASRSTDPREDLGADESRRRPPDPNP